MRVGSRSEATTMSWMNEMRWMMQAEASGMQAPGGTRREPINGETSTQSRQKRTREASQ